ncbi:MAG: hypothetical protein WA789_08710 [Candidatus Acidiferrum sp.]
MSISYPVFAFEKDDHSMHLIEGEDRILRQLEAIDVENDEYVFWDANGGGVRMGVSVGAFKSKLESVSACPASFPIQEAFRLFAASMGISEPLSDGAPVKVWKQIQQIQKDS